jgi:hypothetical protein
MSSKKFKLTVEFLGVDLQQSLEEMAEEIFEDKAIQKQNNIINKAMKAGTVQFKKLLAVAMAPRMRTGASYIHLQVRRIKRTGGWRLTSAKRKDLQDSYPDQNIIDSKFYYPAVQEGGNDTMKRQFEANLSSLRKLVIDHMSARIQREVTKYIRKQKRMK